MTALLIGTVWCTMGSSQEVVGERPYEMEWADRTEDEHPPLVDFEDLEGWTVEAENSEATFERSREQQIWGSYVGKLTYRGTDTRPEVWLRPPAPITIAEPFDAATLWVYGNNWAFSPDPTTPQVGVHALFLDADGNEFAVRLQNVGWKEWSVCHERPTPEQIDRLKAGASFSGFLITGGTNDDLRTIYLDNLAVFTEEFAPLTFEPRPERGIAMFPGQGSGTNTGPGKLPFPTRKQTILPAVLSDAYMNTVSEGLELVYAGPDQRVAYHLEPTTGTFGDLTVSVDDYTFRPCVDGGLYFATDDGPKLADSIEHIGTQRLEDPEFPGEFTPEGAYKVVSRWRMTVDDRAVPITFTYRIWGKSLAIDIAAPGGEVAEVRYGSAEGLENPRLVTLPFYPAAIGGARPAVAVSDTDSGPLFLMGNTCWYLSNASQPFAINEVKDGLATYNGGTRYIPLTSGKRNDCFERLFVTVSDTFEEVLPTVPNPVSQWKHITGTHVWRAHGASNRDADLDHWRKVHRYGMTECAITDHETGWRDGGESFTFRTRTAPKKGGDESQFAYARAMQDELGFVYGPYNNYTDFAPVNEYWSQDRVSRTSANQLQTAWPRCYAPKPARAVEFCDLLAPLIEEKFHFSTAYCDVHTAVAPWDRVDYDPRVPGAGTFAATFYSYGEIMLLQKAAWDGPVYSEGNHHAFYCGLTDGNYGQDARYDLNMNPWLVDFDLLRLHDLCCNFGMGNTGMFFGRHVSLGENAQEIDDSIDRFLAGAVAFGHPGFLTLDGGSFRTALRSYYMIQQLGSHYCLASPAEIRYANEDGELLDTSSAVASGAYQRSQIATRYDDGTTTVVNGHRTDRMVVDAFGLDADLPPHGYAGRSGDGKVEVFSGEVDGHRIDYCRSPAYTFIDGRGKFARYEAAAGNGIVVCRELEGGKREIIPFDGAEGGFSIGGAKAVALDYDRAELGPAEVRVARGKTYAMPVEGAFSYILTGAPAPEVSLTCDRDTVIAGETVTVRGEEEHKVRVPSDAAPGDRLWFEFEGAWIDFTAAPLADVQLALVADNLVATLTSNLSERADGTLTLGEQTAAVTLLPGEPADAPMVLGEPTREDIEVLTFTLRAGPYSQTIETVLRTTLGHRHYADVPQTYEMGIGLRGQDETNNVGETRAYVGPGSTSCGRESKQGYRAHPPWMGAVGYTYTLYEAAGMPDVPCFFRCSVGKQDGSDLGDGILYKVAVVDEASVETIIGEQLVEKHEWLTLEGDLSPWRQKLVQIKLIVDVGENDNSSGDWATWADMRIESPTELLTRTLEDDAERYHREPGPYPIEGLTVADLKGAKSGFLRYDGCGLEGSGGDYASSAMLNGVEFGPMAQAGGSETQGIWVEEVGVPLTPDVIAGLSRRNTFTLLNPRRDFFKVRRFWLELELAGGRQCSSDVSTATFTQPPSWPYAEGIGVPHGKDIAVDIWFDVAE